MDTSENLDAAFAALAHPARRAILARLASGHATIKELAEPFDMSLPAVSRHIHVLEAAGFIVRGKDAQFRPCRLKAEPFEDIAHWTAQYRHIWTTRFDAMADMLENRGSGGNG